MSRAAARSCGVSGLPGGGGRPKTGPETMVGKTAEVVVACRPSGQVRVQGELWEARCAAGADVGEEVRITALEELTLVVEPVPTPPSG